MPELCKYVLRWSATSPDLSVVCDQEVVEWLDYCPVHADWMFGPGFEDEL